MYKTQFLQARFRLERPRAKIAVAVLDGIKILDHTKNSEFLMQVSRCGSIYNARVLPNFIYKTNITVLEIRTITIIPPASLNCSWGSLHPPCRRHGGLGKQARSERRTNLDRSIDV